jgi:hypothetical protein
MGWTVLRLWEHEAIEEMADRVVAVVEELLARRDKAREGLRSASRHVEQGLPGPRTCPSGSGSSINGHAYRTLESVQADENKKAAICGHFCRAL